MDEFQWSIAVISLPLLVTPVSSIADVLGNATFTAGNGFAPLMVTSSPKYRDAAHAFGSDL